MALVVAIVYLLIGAILLYGGYIMVDDWLASREEKAVAQSEEVKKLQARLRKLEEESNREK